MSRPIHFRKVIIDEEHYVKSALTLYQSCFPLNERQPEAVVRERIGMGRAILTVGIVGDMVTCMAITWNFSAPEVQFLDYLAVDQRYRGEGLGSQFLQHLQHNDASRYLVLEVEHPEFGDNKTERLKRISFYQKAGAVLCQGVQYVLPPITPGNKPVEMQLMIMPDPGQAYIREHIKAIVSNIFRNVYGRDEKDPWFQSIFPDKNVRGVSP